MQNETDKDPQALPDEALDEASGGLLPYVEQDAAKAGITDGTSNTKAGYVGGARVVGGDFNRDGDVSLKIADGSVKPGA